VSRISVAFNNLRADGRRGFIPYITVGDPDLDTSRALIVELARAGATLIELGVPFSDPVADGPTIQRAAARALRHHVGLEDVLRILAEARRETDVPVILFSYFNPLLRYGAERLAGDLADPRSGVVIHPGEITAIVATAPARVAAFDPAVAAHPWLTRATEFCLTATRALGPEPFAMELAFAVQLLDAAAARTPGAAELVEGLRGVVPPDGVLHVTGGADDEFMRPLDFAPFPGGPARSLFDPGVVEADLQRLADAQEDDGGWRVDFDSYSAAAVLEWRGSRTVEGLVVLRANGLL